MYLIDIHRPFHAKTKEYTFFIAPHGIFTKIDHLLKLKSNVNREKNNELIPCSLSDHYGIKLVFNGSKNNRKPNTH